jgi:hypothetical protein
MASYVLDPALAFFPCSRVLHVKDRLLPVRGHVSSLLTRRQASHVRVRRQDGQALGRSDRSGTTDAQGPFGLGQVSSLSPFALKIG